MKPDIGCVVGALQVLCFFLPIFGGKNIYEGATAGVFGPSQTMKFRVTRPGFRTFGNARMHPASLPCRIRRKDYLL